MRFCVCRLCCARLIAALVCVLAAVEVEARDLVAHEAPKRVLVLHSYHPSFQTRESAVDTVRAAFSRGYQLEEEYLDTKRLPPAVGFHHMHALLTEKFAHLGKPDLLLTFDDNALVFADLHREGLFAGVPIVFTGVNSERRVIEMASKPGVTGVYEELSVSRTLDLARRLNPTPLTKIVGIVNDSASAQILKAQLAFVASLRFDVTAEWLSLSEHSFKEASEILAQDRRQNVAYMFLGAFRDREGVVLSGAQALSLLGRGSARPIYSLSLRKRHGSVGGHLLSPVAQASSAVSIAKRVLAGESIDAIPPELKSPNVTMINAQLAQKYGLRLDQLGPQAVLYNRKQTFVERNWRPLLVGGVVLAVMLGVLLIVYAIQRRARRGLEGLNLALEQRNTELTVTKARVEHQSLHDELTGLPNRRYVERRFSELAKEPSGAVASSGVWALLHIDLDRFKQINDTLGHPAGDHVLRVSADILRRRLPKDGFAARIGGDEFVVFGLFENEAAVSAYAESLVEQFRRPVPFENHLCRFGASIGAAIAGPEGSGLKALFRHADIALYRAKGDGRGCFAYFSEEHQAQIVASKALADDLVRGLEANEIDAYYQPQVCARSGLVVGVEALARWIHPERGVLPPGAFMPAAANMGLGPEIDRIVLEAAQKRLAEWRETGVRLETISVNLSGRRLIDPTLPETVEALDFGETQLCFELVESIFLERDGDDLHDALHRLRSTGLRIEIDDFGTGHASILGMLRLKPDGLKIARELVDPIERAPERLRLVQSIVEIGKSLQVAVIAEGVETEGQAALLTQLGVDTFQGYLFSRPVPHDEVAAFIQTRADEVAAHNARVA